MIVDLVQALRKLGVSVDLGLAGCLGAVHCCRRFCDLSCALCLGGRCVFLGLGHLEPRRRAVCYVTLCGGGETLFLACFACAAQNAGDDLDAAETGRGC